jgi:hypothetical protein
VVFELIGPVAVRFALRQAGPVTRQTDAPCGAANAPGMGAINRRRLGFAKIRMTPEDYRQAVAPLSPGTQDVLHLARPLLLN